MGLLELLLGKENPATQWAGQNQNFLGAIGSGLGQGQNIQSGLSAGLSQVPQAKALDYQAAQKREAEAKLTAQTNATKDWLAKTYPDLAQAVDAGLPVSDAWNEAFKRQQPGYGELDPTTNMRDFQFAQDNPGYAEFLNPTKPAAAPSGYQWGPDGKMQFIPGGPADPSTAPPKPPTDADVRGAKLSGVIQGDKELLLGANGIYDKLADPWSQAVGAEVGVGGVGVGRPGLAFTSADYQSATNALTNIAQSYLYAISGQAAPAGEVAKIIESVTPKFGEDATSVKNKKARLASYIAAIEASRYNLPGATGADGTQPPVGADADVENILSGLGL